MWELRITRVDNGYKLWSPAESEETIPKEWVIADEDDELKAHENLLWDIMEYFNFGGTRYDKKRLVIRREKGDKNEQEEP